MRSESVESTGSPLKKEPTVCPSRNDFAAAGVPVKSKGRPSNKKRILILLGDLDEPLTASDISERLGLTTQQVQSLLRPLSSNVGPVSKRSPLKHLGERFPSLYWLRGEINE